MKLSFDAAALAALTPEEREEAMRVIQNLHRVVERARRPRSMEQWRLFVLLHEGPGLIADMATELERQGTTIQPWEILRDLIRS